MIESRFLHDAQLALRRINRREKWIKDLIKNHEENVRYCRKSDTLENCNKEDSRADLDICRYPHQQYFSTTFRDDLVAEKLRSIYTKKNSISLHREVRERISDDLRYPYSRIACRQMTEPEYNFLLNSSERQIIKAIRRYGSEDYFKGVRK